jgi:alkaline phosphatase D
MMAMVDFTPGVERGYSMDKWPGYLHDREHLVQYLADRRVANPIVLTGDIHSNWVNDLRVDDRKIETPIVATEFVGTSISSSKDGVDRPSGLDALLSENPCVQFHNQQRGYVRCTVTTDAWQSDFRVVPFVSRPGAPVTTRASYVVEAGLPGAKQA